MLSTATHAAFAPNETQDPGCPPTDINCYVEMPTSYWQPTEGGIHYSNGSVGINTDDLTNALFTIVGQDPDNYVQLLGGDSTDSYNYLDIALQDNSIDDFGGIQIYASPYDGFWITDKNGAQISFYNEGLDYTAIFLGPYADRFAPFFAIMNDTGVNTFEFGNGGLYIQNTHDFPYINFSYDTSMAEVGENGYGFRDNAGIIEYKDSGGDWKPFNSLGESSFEGYSESGTRAGGDLQVIIGDHDYSSNGTKFTLDDSDSRIDIYAQCTLFGRDVVGTLLFSDDCYGGDIGLRNGANDASIAVYIPASGTYEYAGAMLTAYNYTDGGFGGNEVRGISINADGDGYINFAGTPSNAIGDAGYGFRDNAGVMEYRNYGGNWETFVGNGWGLTGNAGTDSSINFIGTTDTDELVFKVNNNFAGTLQGEDASYGNTAFGVDTVLGSGSYNLILGIAAHAPEGDSNSVVGGSAGQSSTGSYNSMFGVSSGQESHGDYNVFLGTASGQAQEGNYNIAIGYNAGSSSGDPLNNSISIGSYANNDSFSDAISIGYDSSNTASNQFMIGSDTSPINTLVLTGASGNTCVLDVTVSSPSCSSDERLKTNITTLSNGILDKVLGIRTVSYDWINFPEKETQIGFLAQDLEYSFPELVSTAPNGYLTVSYAGMAPILTKAIQEINANITDISNLTRENTWRDAITAWFGDVGNAIGDLYADRLRARSEICIDDVCIDKAQLQEIISEQSSGTASAPDDTSDEEEGEGTEEETDPPAEDSADAPVQSPAEESAPQEESTPEAAPTPESPVDEEPAAPTEPIL